jgi:hypothetical protein
MLARSRVSVLHTRNGQTAASVDLPTGTDVWSTVWETNQSLLTLLRHDGKVAIVRVYLDGRVERATPPVGSDGDQSPYALFEPPPIASVPGEIGIRVAVPSHCGVLSVTVDGQQLWLADPPLGDDSGNPPAGWDENETMGYFVETGPRGEFHGDRGQRATFRRAPAGANDPNAGCE